MNESDERYSTAEDAIHDAFFMLLKEKELEKITVSDVVKKAGIVRSTFYNHYENVPALMEAAEDRTIRDIFGMMESFHPKNDRDMCRSIRLIRLLHRRKWMISGISLIPSSPIRDIRGNVSLHST